MTQKGGGHTRDSTDFLFGQDCMAADNYTCVCVCVCLCAYVCVVVVVVVVVVVEEKMPL